MIYERKPSMNTGRVDLLTPTQLSRLLDIDARVSWGEDDAAAALRHQLAAPLLPDLAGLCGATVVLEPSSETGNQTFLDQLTSVRPDIDLLWGLKRFARQMRDEEASPLKGAPATVLYYSAIARSRACTGARIAQLTDGQIREGCQWALAQEGTEALAAMLRDAVARLG
jgi:hypothetical protein